MKIFNRGENTEAYDVYTSGKLKMIRGENSQKQLNLKGMGNEGKSHITSKELVS